MNYGNSNKPETRNRRKAQAKVVGASFGRAGGGTGNEQVAIQFEIVEASGAGDEAGDSRTYFGTFTENALEITEKAMRACGWEGDDLREFKRAADAGDLGAVELVIEEELYKGEWNTKIRFINAPGGGRFKFKEEAEIAGGALDTFAARMKAVFSRPPQAGVNRVNQTQQRRSAEVAKSGGAAGRQAGNGQRSGGGSGVDFGGDDRDVPPPDDLPFTSCALAAEPSPIAAVLRRAT